MCDCCPLGFLRRQHTGYTCHVWSLDLLMTYWLGNVCALAALVNRKHGDPFNTNCLSKVFHKYTYLSNFHFRHKSHMCDCCPWGFLRRQHTGYTCHVWSLDLLMTSWLGNAFALAALVNRKHGDPSNTKCLWKVFHKYTYLSNLVKLWLVQAAYFYFRILTYIALLVIYAQKMKKVRVEHGLYLLHTLSSNKPVLITFVGKNRTN